MVNKTIKISDFLKMNYKLNLARLGIQEVQTVEIQTFKELQDIVYSYIYTLEMDRVYLYQYGGLENPIIISCNPHHILRVFDKNNGFEEHNIHEYTCYEDAYDVAKLMMEPHRLCYE